MAHQSSETNAPAAGDAPGRRALLGGVKRAVIKIGTNVLSRESGEMALGRIHTLIEEIVDIVERNSKPEIPT